MLRLYYAMFPAIKAVFMTATGALYRKAKPTAIRQSQLKGRYS